MKALLFTAVCAAALSLAAEEITLSQAKKLRPISQKIPVDASKDHVLTLETKGGSGKLHIYLYQFPHFSAQPPCQNICSISSF